MHVYNITYVQSLDYWTGLVWLKVLLFYLWPAHGLLTIEDGASHTKVCSALRPFTRGKRFLLFLPDSHSAYYDSFVSALGRSLGLSRICCTWSSFWWGGRLTHPRLQHWVKWLCERVWNFSALGGPTSSVSRRVVKLTVSHYYSAPLPLQKRGYGTKSETLSHS